MLDLEILGERLHVMRRRRGLTLKELAKRTEASYVGICNVEHGLKPQVSLDLVVRLAEELEVSLDYLVGWKEQTTVTPPTTAMVQ